MKEFLSQKPSKPSKGFTTDFRLKSPGKSNFIKIDENSTPNSRILDQKIPKIEDENATLARFGMAPSAGGPADLSAGQFLEFFGEMGGHIWQFL